MYKYYLFISYSRRDSRAAAYLQQQLEHFRVPAKLAAKENLPEKQKFLRPVFRDRRDLRNTDKNFNDDIRIALEQSHYLLVICSPDSAKSKWVAEEITYFLQTHNQDYTKIIPIILYGSLETGRTDECLPSELRIEQIITRNLPSMLPEDGESETEGWENGVVQAISYMLKIEREKIKASVDRERLRQTRIYATIGICVAVIFALMSMWAVHEKQIAERNLKRAINSERQAKEKEELANRERQIAEQNRMEAERNMEKALTNEQLARNQENLAKEQMEIKNQAFFFLRQILQTANPTYNGKQGITLLDALKMKKKDLKDIDNRQLRAFLAIEIGKLFDDHGEYEDAYELTSIAFVYYIENKAGTREVGEACNIMGLILLHKHEYPEALKYFNMAIIHYSKVKKESIIIARIYRNLALVCINLKRFDDAIQYNKMSMDLSQKLNNNLDLARCYSNLGMIYYTRNKENDNEKALQCHKESLNIKLQCLSDKEDFELAANYFNLGLAYLRFNDRDKAYDNVQKAYNIAKKRLDDSHQICKQYLDTMNNIK